MEMEQGPLTESVNLISAPKLGRQRKCSVTRGTSGSLCLWVQQQEYGLRRSTQVHSAMMLPTWSPSRMEGTALPPAFHPGLASRDRL
jgi:hypothetical protein